jgi:hypothetical protein
LPAIQAKKQNDLDEQFTDHVIKFVKAWRKDWEANSKKTKCFNDIDTFQKKIETFQQKFDNTQDEDDKESYKASIAKYGKLMAAKKEQARKNKWEYDERATAADTERISTQEFEEEANSRGWVKTPPKRKHEEFTADDFHTDDDAVEKAKKVLAAAEERKKKKSKKSTDEV